MSWGGAWAASARWGGDWFGADGEAPTFADLAAALSAAGAIARARASATAQLGAGAMGAATVHASARLEHYRALTLACVSQAQLLGSPKASARLRVVVACAGTLGALLGRLRKREAVQRPSAITRQVTLASRIE